LIGNFRSHLVYLVCTLTFSTPFSTKCVLPRFMQLIDACWLTSYLSPVAGAAVSILALVK